VIARDQILVEHDIALVAATDSKDPIARQRNLADLSIDLDFKISSRNVAHRRGNQSVALELQRAFTLG